MDIRVVIETMLKLFAILLLGYYLNKKGIFDAYMNKQLSSLIVNVTSPLMVIASVADVRTPDRAAVFLLIGVGFAMYGAFVIMGKVLVRILPLPKEDYPVYECMCVLANVAFMGYPVVQSVLGPEAVFHAAMLHLAFSFFVYTYAIVNLNKGKGEYRFQVRMLMTPGLLLVLLALLIYVFNIKLPAVLASTVSMVGSVTSPLSMMLIGSSLAMYPIKESLGDWRSYMFSLVKMIGWPVLTLVICRLLNVSEYYTNLAVITNGMPVASMVLMLATQYDANKEIVTRNIIVSTLLSVVSIPLVVALLIH